MLYFSMPIGERYGWGICGRYLLKELSEITDVRYLKDPKNERGNFDPIVQCWVDSFGNHTPDNGSPLLQAINTVEFEMNHDAGKPNVGYTFFEMTKLPHHGVENAKKFDLMVAGSSWCEEMLQEHGIENTTTIIQGVDKNLFYPRPKEWFKDKFVVYSGGKFEFRKGQDLVIRAFKELQDKHDDVLLLCSWFNVWEASMVTMERSPHIDFRFIPELGFLDMMKKTVADAGIDLKKVIFDMPRSHPMMPYVYQNTDVGLFPNRCEGGTNLVLMEYMAMGKSAIMSDSTGHKDLINNGKISCPGTTKIQFECGWQEWPEPDLDETIDKLEAAYQRMDRRRIHYSLPTWAEVAQDFYALVS